MGALSRAVCVSQTLASLLRAGVLGDSLGALAHGVLGQLTGEQETHSGLDLSAGDGSPYSIRGKLGDEYGIAPAAGARYISRPGV